jgi:hypothetical protein
MSSGGNELFRIESGTDEAGPRLVLRGCADALVLQALTSAVGAAHEQASRLHAQKVVLDLRGLEFMNSSCFKVLVSWLNEVRQLPAADRYTVRILSASARHWQRRSLSALTAFAEGLVEVEVES